MLSVIFVLKFLKIIYIMHLIKLSATSSTNDFLKQLSVSQELAPFTVVWAKEQTQGRGQMGASWVTETSKNLTFSIFLKDDAIQINTLFGLNVMIANSIVKALQHFNLTNIYVKWPNDILSYNKKIAGVLIENNVKTDGSIQSIVGIGLNTMQTNFDGFPNASSVFNQYNIELNHEDVITEIVKNIKASLSDFSNIVDLEWDQYHHHLFRKDVVSTLELPNGTKIVGIIKEVNRQGQLVVQLENDDLKSFNLKEIKLLY